MKAPVLPVLVAAATILSACGAGADVKSVSLADLPSTQLLINAHRQSDDPHGVVLSVTVLYDMRNDFCATVPNIHATIGDRAIPLSTSGARFSDGPLQLFPQCAPPAFADLVSEDELGSTVVITDGKSTVHATFGSLSPGTVAPTAPLPTSVHPGDTLSWSADVGGRATESYGVWFARSGSNASPASWASGDALPASLTATVPHDATGDGQLWVEWQLPLVHGACDGASDCEAVLSGATPATPVHIAP